MTQKSANELLVHLEQDPEFKRELWGLKSRDEIVENLKKRGYRFTEEELKKAIKVKIGRELEEEDLKRLSAGGAISALSLPCEVGVSVSH